MANTILITANWHTGALSQQTISRQYDNNRYVVQFVGYPEASEDNELNYYLLVWMSSAPGETPDEIAPIQLASDQWYISNVFTQQTQQIKFQMCALNTEGTFEAHSPIFTGFVRNSLEHDGTTQDIDVSTLFDAYREYLNELIIRAGAVVIDPTLSQSGQAADAKAVGDNISTVLAQIPIIDSIPTQGSTNAVSSGGVYSALADINEEIDSIGGDLTSIVAGGKLLSSGVKTALLNILSHVAYIDGNAQAYIDALTDAWTVEAVLTGITTTFTQGSAEFTDRDALDDLKPYLQVKGIYSVSGATFEEEITDYTLSGTLTEGQSTITVTAGTFTATFTVTVTEWQEYSFYTKIIATGAEYIATDFSETALDGCSYEYKAAPTANSITGSGHIFSAKNTFVAYPQTHSSSYVRRISTRKNYGSERAYGTADNPAWNDGVDMVVQAFVGNDNSVLLDGTTVISRVTAGSAIESDQNYAIFGYGGGVNSSNYRFRGALYYLKVFDANDTLIHHFVPAKSNVTNIAGLYDQISEVFYTSATATAFTVE
jgi:hypothetical protein